MDATRYFEAKSSDLERDAFPSREPRPDRAAALASLLRNVAACEACAAHLPHAPRPVVRVGTGARVLIVGQAPGTRVHATGIPWNDPSGVRLRAWLEVDEATFYDTERFAIMPMGFCYPGKGSSGDLPPRPECAPLWHAQVRAHMPHVRLTLLLSRYAAVHYLGARAQPTVAETVRAWREYAPEYLPLPHPSPRNNLWLRKHPWFERDVLPELRRCVREALAD